MVTLPPSPARDPGNVRADSFGFGQQLTANQRIHWLGWKLLLTHHPSRMQPFASSFHHPSSCLGRAKGSRNQCRKPVFPPFLGVNAENISRGVLPPQQNWISGTDKQKGTCGRQTAPGGMKAKKDLHPVPFVWPRGDLSLFYRTNATSIHSGPSGCRGAAVYRNSPRCSWNR